MAEPEILDLGAVVPSETAHQALMASAEARETRRAIQLGRLAVYFGITERGRHRPEGPEQEVAPLYDCLSDKEFNDLQLAYYSQSLPLFDQFTRSSHVDPNESSIYFYVSGSGEQAAQQAHKLKGTSNQDIRRSMQRQTQHRSDMLCKETNTNLYTAKIRAASLKTTIALIAANQPLDPKAVMFAADAINDFGYSVTANVGQLKRYAKIKFGYTISLIGERAVEDPSILLQPKNIELMDLVLREQRRRYAYWQSRAEAAIKYLGADRLTKGIKEAQAEVDQEIDRQINLRQNIGDA